MMQLLGLIVLGLVLWKGLKALGKAVAKDSRARMEEQTKALGWQRAPSLGDFFRVAATAAFQACVITFLLCSALAPLGSLVGRILRGGK